MVATASSDGPATSAVEFANPQDLVLEVTLRRHVVGKPVERAAEIDRNDAAARRHEDVEFAGDRLRGQRARRSDQDELSRSSEGPGADLLPVVARCILLAIEKHLKSLRFEASHQRRRVDPAIDPGIRDEEVVAEDRVEGPTPDRTLRDVAGAVIGSSLRVRRPVGLSRHRGTIPAEPRASRARLQSGRLVREVFMILTPLKCQACEGE